MEFFFEDVSEKEIQWQLLPYNEEVNEQSNSKWILQPIDDTLAIKRTDANIFEDGITTTISKLYFTYKINLKRVPMPAFIYIVFPTIVITLFNIVSFLLPNGGKHFSFN